MQVGVGRVADRPPVVAVVAAVVYRLLDISGVGGFAIDVAFWIVLYNLLLAIFNLLPIPPLDGYNVLLAFAPPKLAFTIQRYAPYGVIVGLAGSLLATALIQRHIPRTRAARRRAEKATTTASPVMSSSSRP